MDDLISRKAAIDIERNATVDTNPSHFEAHQKFMQFMNDAEISSFGRWQWSNGFNTALTAVGIDLKKMPSAQPEKRTEERTETHACDLISRQAAIDNSFEVYTKEYGWCEVVGVDAISELPSAQPQSEWNNHTVACLLAELFGDDCACNYNGIDEWLPEKCEVIDACPNPVGVACWEQFLTHRAERRTDD